MACLTNPRITGVIPNVAEPETGERLRSEAENLPRAAQPLRVLHAEDSDEGYLLFRANLDGQPIILSRAVNGADALELATTETFDLVFMDAHMPVMDGYEATNRLRRWEGLENRPRIPIVFLSGDDLEEQNRQDIMGSRSGHLSKPYLKDQLLEAIRVHSMPQP